MLTAVRMKDTGAFRRAVLIEYPRAGLYSLAFVTGNAQELFEKAVGKKMISLFVPTTPNPTSGFFLMIPEEDTIKLNLSVQEAFRMIISAGIVGQDDQTIPSGKLFIRRKKKPPKETTS